MPDGRFMQIDLFFGESQVMIADEFPEFGAVSPLTPSGRGPRHVQPPGPFQEDL